MKKLLYFASAVVLSLSSLLTFAMPLTQAATLSCTWTDASGSDSNFSTAGNWSGCGGVAPGTNGGDVYNLVFPGTAAGFSPVLNVSGLTIGSITFTGGGYDIVTDSSNHSVLTITGGITDSSSGSSNEIDLNLVTSASQAFTAGANNQLVLGNGSEHVTIGSNNLTLGNVLVTGPIIGSGNLIINDPNYPGDNNGVDLQAASPGYTGTVQINVGALFVDDPDSLSAAIQITVASGALLKGNGGLSNVTIQSGGTVAPGNSPGCLSANNFTITGTYLSEVQGLNACTGYDQLQVSGTANVTNATLQLSLLNGFTPTIGQSFTILNNTGSNPVTGTFNGLAEGATFSLGGATFQISYVGGDGNDIVLTVINPATAASGSGANAPGTPNTGFGLVAGRPATVLAVTMLAASILLGLARRLKPVK